MQQCAPDWLIQLADLRQRAVIACENTQRLIEDYVAICARCRAAKRRVVQVVSRPGREGDAGF
jgi:hypothetical protein